mgnify:CR=1 FL=1
MAKLFSSRAAYIKKMEAKLEKLESQLKKVKDDIKQKTLDDKLDVNQRLTQLHNQFISCRAQLASLRHSGTGSWNKFQFSLESYLKSISRNLRRTTKHRLN